MRGDTIGAGTSEACDAVVDEGASSGMDVTVTGLRGGTEASAKGDGSNFDSSLATTGIGSGGGVSVIGAGTSEACGAAVGAEGA